MTGQIPVVSWIWQMGFGRATFKKVPFIIDTLAVLSVLHY